MPAAPEPPAPGPARSPTPSRTLAGNRDFVVFWAGETLSLYGTQVTMLALPLTAVLVFGAGPEELGLLRFAQYVPYLALALVFGVWVDRSRRRPVMIGANVARAVLVGLVPALAAADVLRLPLLLVITLAIGVASVLFDVSWMSYVPTLIEDRGQLVEANSKLAVSSSSAEAAGPGIGGVLVGALTAPIAMAVDAVTFAFSVLSLLCIRSVEPRPPRSAQRQLRRELADGLRWVLGDRHLRALALVGCCCNFFIIATTSMFLLYAVRERGLSPAALGLVLSAGAVGGVLGSLAAGTLVRRLPLGRVYAGAVTSIFLGPAVIAVASGPRPLSTAIFVAAFVLIYAGMSVSNVVIVSLRQTVTPNALMARMNAAMRTLMFGGGALGGPAGGLLAGWLGLRPALVVLALGSAAMLVPIILSPVSRLRRMPPPVVDLPVPDVARSTG
ncbi:MAG: MFS transporter [Mycobacteriales bacterium]